MARYSFYLDENVPQEKVLIDYLDPIGNKKGNAIKYLLIQGLTINGIKSNSIVIEDNSNTMNIATEPKIVEQDNNELDSEEIDIDI